MENNLYRLRVEAVLEYIENNIYSDDLSLQKLSNVAGFSSFHFHRIFRAMTGYSLHQYVLRRRIYLAANQLLYENCDITKIALEHGFSTPSAFAKSFKEVLNCTPTQYKEQKERKYPSEFAKIPFRKYTYDEKVEKCISEMDLLDLKTLCIGVIGISESWENPDIEKAYEQIFQWLRTNDCAASTKICGITVDTPEVKALEECMYYACAVVETYTHSQSLAFREFKTSGKYICCKMNRNQKVFAQKFFEHMDYIYGFYLQQHNLLPDYRPFVEFYEPGDDKNINIIFCVPVKSKK